MAAVIRPARASDAPAIAGLTAQLGYDVTVSVAAERLARILERGDQQFLVAVVDERPVGWIHAAVSESVENERFAMIRGLVVDGEHRQHGVGRALMERAEAWARERGCAMVRLTSSTPRVDAHRFYERLGYTNIKTQYSFIKPLDPSAADRIRTFVPRVEPHTTE